MLPRAQLAQEEPERLEKIPAWIATDVPVRNGSDCCMAAKRFWNLQHLSPNVTCARAPGRYRNGRRPLGRPAAPPPPRADLTVADAPA